MHTVLVTVDLPLWIIAHAEALTIAIVLTGTRAGNAVTGLAEASAERYPLVGALVDQ